MANASLTPIYNRLNNAPKYHPLTAETFADWAMEAGDLVTVSRDGNSYTSPVSTSRMVWRGRQQINIESTGSKERPAISKVSRQKYSGSRGAGAAIANNNYIYNEVGTKARVFVSYTDPALTNEVSEGDFWVKSNETETWNDLAASTWTYSSVFNWNDYKGALVYVRDSKGTWRLVGDQQTLLDHSTRIEQDENHISLIAQDVEKVGDTVYRNYAELKVEQEKISADVVNAYAGLESHITQTASSIRLEVANNYAGLNSSITQTASSIRMEVNADYQGLQSSITQTASSIRMEVNNNYAGLSSAITQTASSIRSEVNNNYNGLSSAITQTASSIRSEVNNNYKGLSSTITQTASSIVAEVRADYAGLSSAVTQTASTFNVEVGKRARVYVMYSDPALAGEDVSEGDFWVKSNETETWNDMASTSWTYSSTFNWNDYKGALVYVRDSKGGWRLISDQQTMLDHTTRIEQDEDHISLIAQDVQRIDGNVYRNYAELKVEQDKISADVVNAVNGLESHITQTASSIRLEVANNYAGLSSSITQTASSIRMEVNADYQGLQSSITQTASSIRLEVNNNYAGLSSSITQTSSSIMMEVNNNYAGLNSAITQTASSIRSEVNSKYDGLSSSITQQKDRIDLVVEKKNGQNVIKAASIVTAVNDSGSSVVISADHIDLDGYVTVSDMEALSLLIHEVTTTKLTTEHLVVNDDIKFAGSLKFSTGTGYYDLTDPLMAVQIDGPTNNVYKLQYKRSSDSTWQDAQSFSRATSLSGAWSGSTYTVTATPQGNKISATVGTRLYASNGSYYFAATRTDSSGNVIDMSPITYKLGLSGTTVQVQNSSGTQYANSPTYAIPLETKSITSNGTYTPSSGKVGMSSVTVNVPGHDSVTGDEISLGSYDYYNGAITKSRSGVSGYIWLRKSNGTWVKLRDFSISLNYSALGYKSQGETILATGHYYYYSDTSY